MAEWQEKDDGRIGNTAKPGVYPPAALRADRGDAPVGHFSRNPEGRVSFGPWRRRSLLMGYASPHRFSLLAGNQNPQRRGHAII
jgi:hypothetical protein